MSTMQLRMGALLYCGTMLTFILASLLANYADGCETCSDLPSIPDGYVELNYFHSQQHLMNPSRGFNTLSNGVASSYTPLTLSGLDGTRQRDGILTSWRQIVLDQFVDSLISQDFLNKVRADLDVVRQAKWTIDIRFCYTITSRSQAPYGDATKAWMLQHIAQLSPILHEYQDVIDVLNAGFIGIWGEWYYTTHFGDPNDLDWDNPDYIRGLSPQNWQDRREVLQAILDATPKSIHVQVRYPQAKYVFYDWTPTTEQEMEQQTDKARTAHHNDCFVSSRNDVGTYVDKAREYPYLQGDTVYSSIGGETCSKSTDEVDRHKCPTATKELEELHFSYLNQAYNREVLDEWVADGCYGEIHRRLGYRFVLNKAILPTEVATDGQFCFRLELENVGYAAPYKTWDVAIVLRHTASGNLYSAMLLNEDVRKWIPGVGIVIDSALHVPSSIPTGSYQVLLALRHPSLTAFSDYNILVASRDVPETRTGLNDLLHRLDVVRGAGGGDPDCPQMEVAPVQAESIYPRVFCGWGGCGNTECESFPITNPSFETEGEGWIPHEGGFEYTTDTASHGIRSALVTNGGARQTWTFPVGTQSFQVTADSRNVGVTGTDGNNYSIYCDVKYRDGTWQYGEAAQFEVGNSNWHERTLVVKGVKDIEEAWCYGMFRQYASGSANFDNFRVWISSSEVDTCPAPTATPTAKPKTTPRTAATPNITDTPTDTTSGDLANGAFSYRYPTCLCGMIVVFLLHGFLD